MSAVAAHLAVPFRLDPQGRAVTVVQDSVDDVAQCVAVLLATTPGDRPALPAYGVPDQTFVQRINEALISAAVATWEPRATISVDAQPGRTARVRVHVTTPAAPHTPPPPTILTGGQPPVTAATAGTATSSPVDGGTAGAFTSPSLDGGTAAGSFQAAPLDAGTATNF